MIVGEVDIERLTFHETEHDPPVGLARTVMDQKPFRSPLRGCRRKLGRSRSSMLCASSRAASSTSIRAAISAGDLLRSPASYNRLRPLCAKLLIISVEDTV